MIRSFRDKTTEAVFNGESPKRFPADLVKVARRKLRYLNAAGDLGDLRSPPGNRLEALAGDRSGQHSIRINDQFRLCFVWTSEGPAKVEIVDRSARLVLVANLAHRACEEAPQLAKRIIFVSDQQQLNWQEMVGFLADAVVGTADELLVTRSALTDLTEIWRKRRKFREGSSPAFVQGG